MMNRHISKALLLTAIIWATATNATGQTNLHLLKIFDIYEKESNVTSIELRGEMISAYNMTLFRSITIEDNSSALIVARARLAEDKQNAETIREVMRDGKVTSGFYQMKHPTENGHNRYILFKVMDTNTFAIVYVEGMLDVPSLTQFLKVDNDF